MIFLMIFSMKLLIFFIIKILIFSMKILYFLYEKSSSFSSSYDHFLNDSQNVSVYVFNMGSGMFTRKFLPKKLS